MNAETLHSIANDLVADIVSSALQQRMSELNSAIANAVANPSEPSYQQQVADLRGTVLTTLRQSRINDYPAVWRQYLHEMGIDDDLGNQLADKIEASFSSNQVTLASAGSEVSQL